MLRNQRPGDIGYLDSSGAWRALSPGANNTVLTIASGFPAYSASPSFTNLSVSGWARVGSLVVPTNTTAGDFTAERIWVPDQASSSQTGLINAYSNSATHPFLSRVDSGSPLGRPGFYVQGAAALPIFAGLRSQGTIASPSAVLNGNTLVGLDGYGFVDATTVAGPHGAFRLVASENWSSTNKGTLATLGLTANGSASPVTNHSWTTVAYTITGYVDASVGFRQGTMTAGRVLRSDGTNFVSSTLAGTDVVADYAAYTPTVTQSGTVTSFTTNTVRWSQTGKTVHVSGALVINNAGTAAANNDISVSLPVNWATQALAGMGGTAQIYDSSADILYPAAIRITAAGSFKMVPVDQVATAYGAGGLYLGSLRFTAALATGDQIVFSLNYEAA